MATELGLERKLQSKNTPYYWDIGSRPALRGDCDAMVGFHAHLPIVHLKAFYPRYSCLLWLSRLSYET